ncbi:HNH endonuclease [Agrobacterium rosae]|uniref:HNH endonuclease n=1 Tax=Agrobacterium rosae TaxID=1972867 RepID=UPI002A1776A3|nr:HNH endonuclease [Agrobacterium rosae]MDX8313687.1 HNH endonuclease [Agrobacterium rosae]
MLKRVTSREEFESLLPDDAESFYSLSLLGINGKIFWETQTHWAGFSDAKRQIEIRKARKVYPGLGSKWANIAQPFFVIRSAEEATYFGAYGGHALISPEIFETFFSSFMQPYEVLQDGVSGFKAVDLFEESAFKKVPSPKLRMTTLNRDGRRCRICGRNPDDHLDIELHVHHIRPWSIGGPTSLKNLITLCSTCHKGLDPHYDPTLYSYTDPEKTSPNIQKASQAYVQSVLEYQRIILETDEEM